MTQTQVLPKAAPKNRPAPKTFEEMINQTARVLHDGDWLEDGTKFADVPEIVERLIVHHANLLRERDDVISVIGRRYVPGVPVCNQIQSLISSVGDVALMGSTPITTPAAIQHLQDLFAGTNAAMTIDDAAQSVYLEWRGIEIPTPAHQVVEALDAITTLQNLIEGGE
ncbi:MAG: hypothetical protein Q7J47_03200 [Azoarcus sp.]|nr:hypothetical protein [Azoarcus sp.]